MAAVLGLLAAASCRSPLEDIRTRSVLDPYLEAAIDREVATLGDDTPTLETGGPPSEVEETLAPRRAELDALGPATDTRSTDFSLGADLAGGSQAVVAIDLRTAITTAVANNLAIRVAALEPAVSREDAIAADAAFDLVLFGSASLDKIDEPQTVPVLNGIRLGTPFRASQTYRFETGVTRRLYTGGDVTVSTDLTRFRNDAPGIALSPDPAYTAAVRLGFTQPLLRGFGADVSTATIRVAANAERRAVEQLTTDLLALVEEVEQVYWTTVFTWMDLEIRQWLVDVGREVQEDLGARLDFDTKPAEYSDAVATVEQRKADVIRARRAVRRASDRLKGLLNDPELTVGSEAVLRAAERFATAPISYDLRDAVLTALRERPEIRQALLAIDDAEIARLVADNARLPRLDLTAELAYFGLDAEGRDAYENTLDADFIDYVAGLAFERPFGNRAAEAELRRARLRRTQALLGYRRAVQDVVLEVKGALRDVVTNYDLIQATRSFRVAQAENLRTLEAEEPLRGLTPEFLNLKFQRQEGLAAARREELLALASFDQSLASLYRAMGTGLRRRGIAIDAAVDDHAAR